MDLKKNPAPGQILHELSFTTSRSSGPGGQNVNKVNSRVTLKWDVAHSAILSDEQRETILKMLSGKITNDGILIITAQESRSQLQNKEDAIEKLGSLLQKAFQKQKLRKATKPNKASKRKRLNSKKLNSEKKEWRKKL